MSTTLSLQRKHKRFRVQDGAYVVCKTSHTVAGRLINISLNGLTFDYSAIQEPSMGATQLEIYVTYGGFRLYGTPCKPMWDLITYQVPTTSQHMRQCSMEFGQLTPQQAPQLEYFIQNHTVGEV